MILLILLLMCGVAQADVYVLTAPDKSVYGLSEQDDMVVPTGYKKDIIKNKKIQDLTITPGEEKLYDFSGNKFTPNAKRLQEKNKADNDAVLAEQKQDSDKKLAIDKLKTLGLTEDEVKAILR